MNYLNNPQYNLYLHIHSNLLNRFKNELERTTELIRPSCEAVLKYLALGCVLKLTYKFLNINVNGEDFKAIATLVTFDEIVEVAKSLDNVNAAPLPYCLKYFAKIHQSELSDIKKRYGSRSDYNFFVNSSKTDSQTTIKDF